MRCVLDTNVIVSAILFRQSKPAQVFHKVVDEGTFLISKGSHEELKVTLTKAKFDQYLTLEQRFFYLHRLLKRAKKIEPKEKITACRDPKDNMFLELAVSGQANYIITGDQDLLVLNPFRNIQILTPAEFLKLKK